MIGRFALEAPPIDDQLSQMVETHRSKTGQSYSAILFFGLWGTVDCSSEVRLYAGYRHLEADPEDGPAWLETSRAHLEAGEGEMALAIVDELVRLDCPGIRAELYSEDPEIHRAHILADSGRLDDALSALERLEGRHADSPMFHYTLGSVLHEKGGFAKAAAAYAKAGRALEEFRKEALEEGLEDEIGVDFPAAGAFLAAAERKAERRAAFAGSRPLDLSGLREE